MKKIAILSLVPLALLLTGCKPHAQGPISAEQLQNDWVLTQIDGNAIPLQEGQIIPNMAIDSTLKVSGFGGCNRFFGQGELKKAEFKIDNLGQTRMMCIQNEQATNEAIIAKTLSNWSEITLSNHLLTLKGSDHTLQFKPETDLK